MLEEEEEFEIEAYQDLAQILKESYDNLDELIRAKQKVKGFAKYKIEAMVKAQEALYQARRQLLELIGAVT